MEIKSIVYLKSNPVEELACILATGYMRYKGIQFSNPDGFNGIVYEPEVVRVFRNEEKPL
jgi:hypothetical protein